MKQVFWAFVFIAVIAVLCLGSGFVTGVQEVLAGNITVPVYNNNAVVIDLPYYGELAAHKLAGVLPQ
ncbi:TMhelix containing protein [Vibrio phage 2.275.O._10N.286.54.E11]|nr:TMhelix containing protein [Vibrio phage 2.275.O._10N.286.54.E11]